MTMNLSLIVCTYQRPVAVVKLLDSVLNQHRYPDEIVIVDGSTNDLTREALEVNSYPNLRYYSVDETQRGLTKQRNFGIAHVADHADVVCFLDDDTVLEPTFFEALLSTYTIYPDALAVGGIITNQVVWSTVQPHEQIDSNYYVYDGWKRKEASRFQLRKRLGLASSNAPGIMPNFAHGRGIAFLPPSGKIYEVEHIMGGVASYRKSVFEKLQFSTYFEGYALYEDVDFSLRVSQLGKVLVNTQAKLAHYHDPGGRPNLFNYGKMVVRNGYYVWRVKYSSPPFIGRLKWNLNVGLLTLIRFSNVFDSGDKKGAWQETRGRLAGWWSVIINPPKQMN